MSSVTCRRPTTNPRHHRWHKIKSRKSKSATYSRTHNPKRSSFTKDDRYPRLSLPKGAMQSLRKEFGMTKIAAIDVLTEDDLAIRWRQTEAADLCR